MKVAEALNIIKDAVHGGMARWITVEQDLFELELSEEALHRGIVPTVATAVHAPFDAGCA